MVYYNESMITDPPPTGWNQITEPLHPCVWLTLDINRRMQPYCCCACTQQSMQNNHGLTADRVESNH